ncbi:serine hydrolase [Sphingomonas sp. M1-B02]|uniref:serine hydrolase n=1 Tax=Sphingomonas sp. M1-B02 TaxID=3114300 RepID=UPI002240B124|nr:serine hydrolase [Sphingomonas sp. S6-11]UZK66003.1 serine hydrolase [Sphingomonas sp. S6-11]
MRLSLLLPILALVAPLPAAAQPQSAPAPAAAPVRADPALAARARELVAILGGAGDYDALFAPGFRTAIPKAKLDPVNAQLAATGGPIVGIESIEPQTPFSGLVKVAYRNAVASIALVLDPRPPHQVTGLRVLGMSGRERTLDEVAAALRTLPGATGFALAKLGDSTPQLLAFHQPEQRFAIGSAFKLVILAELVRATTANERKWDDLVTLDGSMLPAGGYNLKPKGTQVSLRELATQMISISDNSATDILLKTLGRERVEAMLPVVGAAPDPRNRPFLSTMEMFKLKGIADLAPRYLALDEAGRRRMLDREIADAPALLIRPDLFRDGKPVMIDTLEWYMSPADLVRVMDWLRRNSEGPAGAEARAILSKNPGIPRNVASGWQWVGFKGGSEPGVLNLTLLLQAKDGDWYALTGSWNDPARDVDTLRFVGLIGRAAELDFGAP